MAKKKDTLQQQIQKMEDEARHKAMARNAKQAVPFDTWFALREKVIPPQHMKEIIAAEFKARKLKNVETMEIFDQALEKYGVKLS